MWHEPCQPGFTAWSRLSSWRPDTVFPRGRFEPRLYSRVRVSNSGWGEMSSALRHGAFLLALEASLWLHGAWRGGSRGSEA